MINRLPTSKAALRATLADMVADYLARGGSITVCRPARARGSR